MDYKMPPKDLTTYNPIDVSPEKAIQDSAKNIDSLKKQDDRKQRMAIWILVIMLIGLSALFFIQ